MKVPKKYEERFYKLEQGEDLIDGCKYILYFAAKSKKEALQFIREATREEEQ